MWRGKNEERRNPAVSSLLKKRSCVEGEGYLVRNEVCLSLKELGGVVEKVKAALTIQELFGGVLAGLRGGSRLALLPKCGIERICVNGKRVLDGSVRMRVSEVGVYKWGLFS